MNTKVDWDAIRQAISGGASVAELSEMFHVERQILWDMIDRGDLPRRPAALRTIIDSAHSKADRSVAEDEHATKLAEVLQRHRTEPGIFRERVYVATKAHKDAAVPADKVKALADLRFAKTAMETINLIQMAERRAWGMDDADRATPPTIVIERSYV